MGVKRADKRRMDEMRVEVGVYTSFKDKLTRSSLVWACRVERMRDNKNRYPESGGEKESTMTENVI